MPIDLDNLNEFRSILNELGAKKGLTTNKLVAIWDEYRDGKGNEFPSISANTLRGFKAGKDTTKTAVLVALWDFLEQHKTYGFALKSSRQEVSLPPPEEALAIALTRFFSDSEELKSKPKNVGKIFRGEYTMYRPGWKAGKKRNKIATSLVKIVDEKFAPAISEIQNFKAPGDSYYQKDSGFLFTFGEYIYFLMREDNNGTSIKFGAIAKYFPITLNQKVNYFYGTLYVTSHLALYPAQKFYCILNPPGTKVQSKHYDPDDPEVPADVIDHLRDDLR